MILVVGVSGGTFLAGPEFSESTSFTQGSQTTVFDCKQDMDCLVRASRDCNLAKVDYTARIEVLGVKQTTKSHFEIRGAEAKKCIFYFRIEKVDLEFPPTVPSEIVNQQKSIYKTLEGKTGNCKMDTKDLTAMLARWKRGELSTDDFRLGECDGTYFAPR